MDGETFLRETAQLVGFGWCRGADARDRNGAAVAASDEAAVAWSLLGALAAVSERPGADAAALRDALWGVSGVIADASLERWNDVPGRTQAETLQLLRDAATCLAEQPPPGSGWRLNGG